MNLSELTENSNKQLVIIYPGRFHPFHIGHGKVYKYLKQKYSNAKVFIATSGKVDGDRSPFTFDEKKKMMMLAGVDGNAIVQTKSPYQSVEIMERFDKDATVMVFAVSEKDMAEDPRFDFSGGIKLKKNGEPTYLQKWNGLEDAETFGTRGYIATTPTFPFELLGQKINSASQIRNMIANSDDTKLTQILQDLYNVTDVPQDVIELFKNKIGNKETMNENWDEHSFSEYLKENVIEDNIMKRNILQAISEGKSPHKKGTKKYKAHMAAMHAESVDDEFDAKIKEVLEAKKTNEEQLDEILPVLVGGAAAAVGTAAYQAGKKIGNWISSKKTATADTLPGDGMVKKAGSALQTRKTQMNKNLGALKNESEQKERPYLCFHVKKGKYETFATSSYDAAKNAAEHWGLKSTAGITVLADVEHVAENSYHNEQHEKLEYIHSVLQDCGDGNTDITMVEQAIEYVEDIREQHFDDEGNTKSESVTEDQAQADRYHNETLGLLIKKLHRIHDGIDNGYTTETIQQTLKLVMTELENLKLAFPNKAYESVNEAPDHEVSMARKDVQRLAKYSLELEQMLSNVSEEEGLQGWVQAKITKAADYISSVKHYMEGNEPVSEAEVSVDNEGNIAGYLDTVDEYVAQLFKLAPELGMEGATAKKIAYRIQNAVDDIRTRELGLKPSNIRASYANESAETVNEHEIGLLGKVARQMEADAHSGDYTAIEELLHNVSEEEMEAYLSDHRSPNEWPDESVNEGVLAKTSTGDYKAVSSDGVVRIMYKGKEIASGDFDSGADGWFVSREGDKGQKFFSDAMKMVNYFADKKITEWVQDSPAQGFSGQERNFIQELCLRMDGISKTPNGLQWMGKSKTWDEGNVLSDKGKLTTVMLWAKRNIDDLYDRMGSEFKVYSDGNDEGDSGRGQSDGNQIIQNIIKKIGKIGEVTEDTTDVTPKGYGPDDYDEKDVAPEHNGELDKIQDVYKHNEDRNNHSENILMLAQAFGSRPEIKAVEGLLTIIRRQGYTTPEQSEMMYNAIHKKYYKQLFPSENEGNAFSGELAKAKIDGKKQFDVDGKTYKVKEALSKLIDKQTTNEAGIMHYSDAKGTTEYKEGQKAAKNGEPYDSNPYSGAEKLRWSKGHNEWRHANKRKKGEPNFGAKGQFEGKK